jgi:hypothetical protein
MYTKKVLTGENGFAYGDVTRLGYIFYSLYPRKNDNNLPKLHHEISDSKDDMKCVDIVTMGDSFSNGGGGGLNSFYQDYIVSVYNKNVINIQSGYGNFIDPIVFLTNSGYIDSLKPKYIIIESAEKYVTERFLQDTDFNQNISSDSLKKYLNQVKIGQEHKYSFINNGNYKFIFFNSLRLFSENAFFNVIYKSKLNNDFFSVTNPRDLLFHIDEIKSLKRNSKENIELVNANLNRLADFLNRKNIKLIFLIAPDKYDVYSDFLVEENKYGNNRLFEELKKLPKNYVFIDTKSILQQAVKHGDKDIYYADDTHWSYKASELIIKSIEFQSIFKDK